jgi:hypothetical protein
MSVFRICVLAMMLVSGCSSVNPGKRFGDVPLRDLKSAYVVRHPHSKRDIDIYIQEALADRGVRATSGPMESKPKDVDFYVEYTDHWKWDIAMYLNSLDIRFARNSDGVLIASGSFESHFPHGFPDAEKKTREVIEQIYNAK